MKGIKYIRRCLPWMIYISGCFASYPVGKEAFLSMAMHEYTVRDRATNIGLCIFSWVDFFTLKAWMWSRSASMNEPAKW